jgi:hypothetical protein
VHIASPSAAASNFIKHSTSKRSISKSSVFIISDIAYFNAICKASNCCDVEVVAVIFFADDDDDDRRCSFSCVTGKISNSDNKLAKIRITNRWILSSVLLSRP